MNYFFIKACVVRKQSKCSDNDGTRNSLLIFSSRSVSLSLSLPHSRTRPDYGCDTHSPSRKKIIIIERSIFWMNWFVSRQGTIHEMMYCPDSCDSSFSSAFKHYVWIAYFCHCYINFWGLICIFPHSTLLKTLNRHVQLWCDVMMWWWTDDSKM